MIQQGLDNINVSPSGCPSKCSSSFRILQVDFDVRVTEEHFDDTLVPGHGGQCQQIVAIIVSLVDEFGTCTMTCEGKIVEFCEILLCHISKDNTISGIVTTSTRENNESANTTEMLTSTMKRIELLTSLFDVSLSTRVKLSELMIACRRRMMHTGLYAIWLETLIRVAPQSPETGMDLSLISTGEMTVNNESEVHQKTILLERIITFEKKRTLSQS